MDGSHAGGMLWPRQRRPIHLSCLSISEMGRENMESLAVCGTGSFSLQKCTFTCGCSHGQI